MVMGVLGGAFTSGSGESVVVTIGVLAGRTAILLWMRFLRFGFQGTNQDSLLAARSGPK